jgi:hypothetical protein
MTDARTLTAALRGRWYGRYGSAFCPAHHNTRTPALSLRDGDDGRLLAHCFAGCGFRDVLAALRGSGLVEGGGAYVAPDPTAALRRRAEAAAEAAKRAAQAGAVWAEALPINGTPAETYLRGRGIDCALPETLRYAPACWHASGIRLPAMVALVEGGDGFAVHRTYLRPDGAGKAVVEPNKAMLGAVGGGAVRLVDAPGALVVAEGVETGLSLASGLLRAPAAVWAALSTSGMKALRLPRMAGDLTVAGDSDPAGEAAAVALAERALALGWRVKLLNPPDDGDWNDVLRREMTQ